MSLDMAGLYEKIYKYCYYKTGNCHLAEDLTQETFLRYFSQNSYLNRGKPLAYLYTVARNLCIDSYRKQTACSLNEENLNEIFMEDKGANEIEILQTSVSIRQAMVILEEKQQELIYLRYVNELSMEEISCITGMSRFAIRRSINSGLKELRKTLNKEDFYG